MSTMVSCILYLVSDVILSQSCDFTLFMGSSCGLVTKFTFQVSFEVNIFLHTRK